MKPIRRGWFWLLWLAAPILLWFSLRGVPLAGIVDTLGRIHPWQIGVLILLNGMILILIFSRWHLILQTMKQSVPFFTLAGYRLAGFAFSYFTPGTQFGGEPLQVLLLQKRSQVPSAAALSSVYLDKLLELLSNFTFLIFGLLVLLQRGTISQVPNAWMGWFLPAILVFPAAHLIGLWKGMRPAGAIIKWLCGRFPKSRLFCRIHDVVYEAEGEIIIFARRRPEELIQSLILSGLVWVFMVVEFGLVYRFLGAGFSLLEIVTALVFARLSFLVPVPAGLGALEGSQVLAMTLLGVDPAVGVAACLWIRLRDVLLGLTGFWVGGLLAGKEIREG